MKQQWAAFVSRLNPGDEAPSLEEVGAILRTFLLPCISGSTAIHQQGRAKGCPAHIQRIVRNRYRLKDIEALQIPPCYSPHLRVLGNTLQLRSLNHTALG